MIFPIHYGVVGLSCDECFCFPAGVSFETFREAAQYARRNNWQVRKTAEEWEHFCPQCSRKLGYLPPLPPEPMAYHHNLNRREDGA